jgi:hypothetical protein
MAFSRLNPTTVVKAPNRWLEDIAGSPADPLGCAGTGVKVWILVIGVL